MRVVKTLAAVALVLLLAAPVAARSDALSGTGELTMKDMSAQTVTIQGRIFHVTDRTRIRNHSGKPITLAQLDLPQPGEKGLWEILGARYSAAEVRGRMVLITLELVDKVPN